MKMNPNLMLCCALLLAFFHAVWSHAEEGQSLDERYPGLVLGLLQKARLSLLPEGELLRIADKPVTVADFEKTLKADEEATSEQEAGGDALYRLEEYVMVSLVRQEMGIVDDRDMDEDAVGEMFRDYFEKTTQDVTVSEEEMRAFFDEVKGEINAGYDDVKPQLREYMVQNKKQEKFAAQLETVFQRTPIRISEPWVDDQVKRLRDNVVDKARAAGMPLLVNFGAEWCPPCRHMKPIIAGIAEKFSGKLTALVVDVDKSKSLARMYKVENIPLLLFFDKEGKEIHRREGALTEEELIATLKDIGVS